MSKYVQDNEWGTKYPNFRKAEFKCPCCGSYGVGIASSLVELLQKLRNKYGSVIISSGYRCSKFNKKVGGATNSAHLKGQAADFYFSSGILANQSKRIAVVNEIKKMKNYHYSYCNVNGNHPNMGAAIHVDTNLVDVDPSPTPTKKYIQLDGNVWCRTGGYGFKYPKYKVIPKNTKCELITKNIGKSDGYSWDKIIYNGKTVYLPNKWNKYL